MTKGGTKVELAGADEIEGLKTNAEDGDDNGDDEEEDEEKKKTEVERKKSIATQLRRESVFEDALSAPPAEVALNMEDFFQTSRYVIVILIVSELITMCAVSSMIYMVYAGAAPTVTGCNTKAGRPVPIPHNATICGILPTLRDTTKCTPQLDYQFKSVNVEFDYICSDSTTVKGSISIQFIGVLIGSFIFGQFGDSHGRKMAILVNLAGLFVFSLATAFAPTFLVFTILRVFSGIFTGGITAVMGVYLVENIPKRHRLWITTVVAWSPNFIVYPFIAMAAGEWRRLSAANAAIALITAISLLFVHESPRWLIQKGRLEEARRVLVAIRKFNRQKDESGQRALDALLRLEQAKLNNHSHKKKYYIYHAFSTWQLAAWTITLCSGICTASLINYSLIFNMEKLSGSIYINNALFGVVRWASNIAVGALDFFLPWVGRKTINFWSVLYNAISLLVICLIYYFDVSTKYTTVIRILTITVTAMCSQIYLAHFMTSNELYPTAVRSIAASLLAISSRVGTIFAPQLFYLSALHNVVPYAIIATAGFINLFAFQCILPETKGRPMEDNLPSKEQRTHGKRDRKLLADQPKPTDESVELQ